MNDQLKAKIHTIYGIALVLAGFGVLYRIPQVMPRITQIAQFEAASWFIHFCLYLMALALIVGGGRKIYENYKILSGKRDRK
jgi:hypothetical protein